MTSETKIAFASALVSSLALTLTLYEAWATRRHNRLSVKPALSYDLTLEQTLGELIIRLRNNGLGPARVYRYEKLVDGRSLKELNIKQFQELSTHLGVQARYSMPVRDDVIPIGASIDLIAIKHEASKPEARAAARQAARRLTIRTVYWSMYDESFRAEFDGNAIIPAE